MRSVPPRYRSYIRGVEDLPATDEWVKIREAQAINDAARAQGVPEEDIVAWTSDKVVGIATGEPYKGYQADSVGWINPGNWQGRKAPSRQWQVEGCLPVGNVSLLSGDGGIGKTILLLQLCIAAATGKDWLGIKPKPGRAIYLSCEDDHDELWRRTEDIAAAFDVEMADIGENAIWIDRVGKDSKLIEFERFTGKPDSTNLWMRLMVRARSFGATYIVIDTATQTFGGNQNNETQVAAYINQLRRLAIAIQGAVILTKHPSLSGRGNGTGMSGTVAWENSVRSRLYFRKNKSGIRELVGMKSNYGLPLEPIALRYERGVFVPMTPDIPTGQIE
jgi:RecA-family ATPase